MFAQDKDRGNSRGGSSSWDDGGWNSFGNTSREFRHIEGHEDYRSSGRNYSQKDSRSSDIVCQSFLQNKCTRGNSCPFQHPSLSSSKPRPLASTLNTKRLQNAWLNFCPDFPRGQCPYTDDCRLLHVSSQDELEYQTTGDIPTGIVEQAMSKSMLMDWAYIGNQPHCKDYLQGSCTMNDCRLRHLNTDQYVVEVLQALREKFDMFANTGPQSPQHSSGSFGSNRNEQYGETRPGTSRSRDNHENNQFGAGRGSGLPLRGQGSDFDQDSFEPESKRMRSDGMRQRGGSDNYLSADESFLDKLRRDNVELSVTSENVKKSVRTLEDENTELRKALRLALDLNSYSRSLPEFRNQLRDIMMSLRKKGFQPDLPSNSSSRNSMQMKSMNSGQEQGRYNSGYRYILAGHAVERPHPSTQIYSVTAYLAGYQYIFWDSKRLSLHHLRLFAMADNEKNRFVPRITQLDALFLNNEAYSLMKNHLLYAVKYVGQTVLTKLEPEIDAFLKYVILRYTVQKARSSVGQQLLLLKYEDSVPAKILKRYILLLVLGNWAKMRLGDVIYTVTKRPADKEKAEQFVNIFEITYRIVQLFNLLLFLHQGIYPTLLERLFGLKLVSSQPGTVRKISYVYFTRELLWHGFAELLAFVLPLINVQYFHNVVRKFLPQSNEENNEDYDAQVDFVSETTCVVCNNLPVLPHCFGCRHIACYYCISSSYSMDSTFSCPLCSHKIENQIQIVPAYVS
ncbi:hypothetical protein SK128_026727 [Halocaridina rubra]|uniref:RING-type E3 ubiquitin transferase (cysteine targeting) n=1 Tax=Halocaridina rubra TaxID=373956 RepID=A0AAN8XLW4_HALRR